MIVFCGKNRKGPIMSYEKMEYILRSLQSIARKKWELWVISRIIHKLDDPEIEFVTQQVVRTEKHQRALVDIYFPQFNIFLEIDEPFHEKYLEEDERRAQDIVAVTEGAIHRIRVTACDTQKEKPIETILEEVDKFIDLLNKAKSEQVLKKSFTPWNFESRYDPEPIIKRGIITVSDNVLFRTQLRLKFQVQHPAPSGHRMLRWTNDTSTSTARNVA